MKYKRIIVFCLVFLMLLEMVVSAANNRPQYEEATNKLTWETEVPLALPGVSYKYQTLGFKATLTHSSGNVYFIQVHRLIYGLFIMLYSISLFIVKGMIKW